MNATQRVALAAVCATLGASPEATARVEQLIASLEDPLDRTRLGAMLSALEWPIVNLLLSGRFGRFSALSPAAREHVLATWAFSGLAQRRAGFQALKRLSQVAHYCWPEQNGSHPVWRAVGYPGPLPPPDKPVAPLPTVSIDFSARDTTLECDVVVVGSGAGGGVVAGVLAAAGKSVVVLEKGPNPGSRDLTQVEGEMLGSLYENHGLLMTQSGSMPVLAGSCLGGGTVINYTTSFRLPDATRAEWQRESGLSLFTSPHLTESFDRVSARLDVNTRTTPGARDRLLEKGLRALGWHVDALPRNVTDCREGLECGYCGYGCRHGAKNSTAKTYLSDAARDGARLIVGCDVHRVLTEGGRATGVVATVRGPDGRRLTLTVRAKTVVAACGAVSTPALLVRSGLSNPNIGRWLRLHPATALLGHFPERVEPWGGALQTRYSDQFANQGDGYGAKFETAPMHFALPASAIGWESPQKTREEVAQLAHRSLVGILLRDRDPGRITVSRRGHARVHYDLSTHSVERLRPAIRGAAEVLAAAGATEIMSLHTPPARVRPGASGQYGWLDAFTAAMEARGFTKNRMSYISFHQMASARMGREPRDSVVGETGETHELRGLYVADGSLFPTSSGVNPMLTIMALADQVARGIAGT